MHQKNNHFLRGNTWNKLEKRIPKWPPNRTKKRSETTMKKRPKNRRKKGSPETCLSKWTGSALIVSYFASSRNVFASAEKVGSLRSLARCARSLAALATRLPIIPINFGRNPKRPMWIPYKFRTKSPMSLPWNPCEFANKSNDFPCNSLRIPRECRWKS